MHDEKLYFCKKKKINPFSQSFIFIFSFFFSQSLRNSFFRFVNRIKIFSRSAYNETVVAQVHAVSFNANIN